MVKEYGINLYHRSFEDGLSKTEIQWSLQCIYMIFNFLIMLKV
jgi:hypothetical protein